ncbi:MAG: hypothetical protein FP814_13160 [Desulfobacterium sp.]|nr:hypothetical protein [Desulfobacteraceae bacterium]MBA3037426.1 hypothetical protein [Desulfobacterium sp.]
MSYEFIIYEKEGKIARITMNVPKKHNPLGKPMMREIVAAMEDAAEDREIKVVVIKGAGKSFSSGHDIPKIGMDIELGPEYAGKRPPAKLLIERDEWLKEEFYQYVYTYAKPTIAQVHGYCIYGGNNFQLCCDITIAAEDSQFKPKGDTIVTIASYMPADTWSTAFGPRHLGVKMDGKIAEKWGIVNKAVPLEQLEEEVEKMARAVALMPDDSLNMNKKCLNSMMEFDGLEAAWNTTHIAHAMGTHQRIRSDEFNIFKTRADQGASAAIKSRQRKR